MSGDPTTDEGVEDDMDGSSGMERRAPEGIVCALITPFGPDQAPDLGALGELVDTHVEAGTAGLFVLGTTGEGVLLEAEDRRRVAEAALRRAGGRIAVIVHCGAADTRTAANLARHAEGAGAQGVAVVAPYFFAYRQAELLEHFTRVARAAPGVGHYVYENPERVGYSVGVALVRRLVAEVENVRGVKDTGDSIGRVTRYLAGDGPRPEVYTGNNVTILPALLVGARGAVSALANGVPELVAGIHAEWKAGNVEAARRLQFLVASLAGCLEGLPYVGAVKHLVSRRGLPAGGTRAPQRLLAPEEAALLEARLAAVEGLEPWLRPVGSRTADRASS